MLATLHFISQPPVFITSYVEVLTVLTLFSVAGGLVSWWHHASPDHGHPQCRKHTIHQHPSLGGPGGEAHPGPQAGHGATI